jgi:hypothetical protein
MARVLPRASSSGSVADLGELFSALLRPSTLYTLEERAVRPADAFSEAAAAAEAAQLKLMSSASVAAAIGQSKQVADIMQLYSQLQTTYHAAMLALLECQGPLAGTTAGLAYTWFCDAMGKEPELNPGDNVSLQELNAFAAKLLAAKNRSPLGLAAATTARVLNLKSANQPVEALVLPDMLSYLSAGSKAVPDGIVALSGSECFASKESTARVLLLALTPLCPPTRVANPDATALTETLHLRLVTWHFSMQAKDAHIIAKRPWSYAGYIELHSQHPLITLHACDCSPGSVSCKACHRSVPTLGRVAPPTWWCCCSELY